jgi:hypothetical protein
MLIWALGKIGWKRINCLEAKIPKKNKFQIPKRLFFFFEIKYIMPRKPK